MTRTRIALVAVVVIVGVVWATSGRTPSGTGTFVEMPLPEGIAGDCKAVGDIDGDGLLDLVVGGKGPGEPLTWYRHGTWAARVIYVSDEELSNDCVVTDLNGDGFDDVLVPDGTVSPDNLLWLENPGHDTVLRSEPWERHGIGHTDEWCKDLRVADFDADGRPDIASKPMGRPPLLFFAELDGEWSSVELVARDSGREGLAAGDVDRDGDVDLVVRGAWLENPGRGAARDPGAWARHPIGQAPDDFKAVVADLDGDTDQDILVSSSEDDGPTVWWEHDGGQWTRHVISQRSAAAHTLLAQDFDLDGDLDVLIGELRGERIVLYRNDGRGVQWVEESIPIERGSIHNGVVADLDRDGDPDVFAAGYTGQPVTATIWWNRTDPRRVSFGPFTPIEVTRSHARAFGSVVADLDDDGRDDIAAGPFWYQNPGSDLHGPWEQHALPRADDRLVDVLAVVDLGDGVPTMAAMTPDARLWRILDGPGGARAVEVGRLPVADHEISSQGVGVARLRDGGPRELVLSNGGEAAEGVGVYAFELVPEGVWSRRRITTRTSDEGIALGDIDRDGDIDLVGTRGDLGEIEWYENPGNGDQDWPAHPVATVDGVTWLDRVRVADLSCDGRLDVVVTEENGSKRGAQTLWLEQPGDLSQSWRVHRLASQASTNSLDVADLDRDGDIDIITAEHKGGLAVVAWENLDCRHFEAHRIDEGKESHLGAKAVDLDRDGDLDIFSIAWDDPTRIHLWRNDAISARDEPNR